MSRKRLRKQIENCQDPYTLEALTFEIAAYEAHRRKNRKSKKIR